MSIIHADRHISRCPSCGSWRWRARCRTCEQANHEVKETA